jgi:hypothetical protein
MPETLVVNLFGGPGVSKSTNRALVFAKLKLAGHNVEEAPEFAKELVWEGRHKALRFQQYIIGKQMWRVERLRGEVEVVITDSPILFGLIYGKDYSQAWEDHLIEVHQSWRTLNIHLIRDFEKHPYNPKGRTQTQEEAVEVDGQIERMLSHLTIPHSKVQVQAGQATSDLITNLVEEQLG